MLTMLSTLEPRVTDSVNDVVNLIDVNEVKDHLVTGVGMCGFFARLLGVSVCQGKGLSPNLLLELRQADLAQTPLVNKL